MGFGSTDFDIDVYLCENGCELYLNEFYHLEIPLNSYPYSINFIACPKMNKRYFVNCLLYEY